MESLLKACLLFLALALIGAGCAFERNGGDLQKIVGGACTGGVLALIYFFGCKH